LAAGRAGAGKGCCAKAADESTSDAASAAIAIRTLGKGIKITVWQKNVFDVSNIAKPAEKEMRYVAWIERSEIRGEAPDITERI